MSFSNIPGAPGYRQAPPPNRRRKPAVVLQPRTSKALSRGINLIANAVRPTLGPRPRLVALERIIRTEAAEILDDGATIARRITNIRPRSSDVGAMLIRQALWKMHMEAGDGATTMAVMYQVIFNEGLRYITQAGANAMLLRRGLETGLCAVLEALERAAVPIAGKDSITLMARGICQEDVEMAEILGEIFDMVGPEGLIVIEGGNRGKIEREYIDGTYWPLSGWLSRLFITDKAERRATFEDAAILISDLKITDPMELVPVLDRCAQAGIKKLVILCKELSDSAVGLLVTNKQANIIEAIAVRTPKVRGAEQVAAMEDIAVLTGGRTFFAEANDTFKDFQVEDLGFARRVWALESLFGLLGGKGDPRQVRQMIRQIRDRLPQAETDNDKKNLQQRLGRLSGSTVIMRVGGMTATEFEVRKGMAERAVLALRRSIQGGVVVGGGVALLNAQAALQGLPIALEEDALAYKILARALEEPLRTIARNAGAVPEVVAEKAKELPAGFGFDARSRKMADLRQAGLVDSFLVLKKALEIAVSGAALALTTDVIVHHIEPKESIEP